VSAISPEEQLESFIARYTPEVAQVAKAAFAKLRKRLPGAVIMVYDNYNALAIGFGPSDRASEAICSLALFPRWVNFFLLQGATLPDPHKVLQGKGKQARHIVLEGASTLDKPAVRELIALAIDESSKPLDRSGPGPIIIKSISAKQRPRRPADVAKLPRKRRP
jgi:hypothetical protein